MLHQTTDNPRLGQVKLISAYFMVRILTTYVKFSYKVYKPTSCYRIVIEFTACRDIKTARTNLYTNIPLLISSNYIVQIPPVSMIVIKIVVIFALFYTSRVTKMLRSRHLAENLLDEIQEEDLQAIDFRMRQASKTELGKTIKISNSLWTLKGQCLSSYV